MATKRDYYEILGISKQATQDEVKRSFRRLAMQYHPDRNKAPDAEQKFKEINEAYEVLSDTKRRQTYDQFGHEGLNQQGWTGGSNPFDIFNDMFGGSGGVKFSFGGNGGGFEDIFGQMFGGGRRRSSNRRQNQQIYDLDIDANLTISFLESILGVQRKVKINVKRQCPHCNGTGAETPNDIKTCPKCRGTGVITTRQRTILGIMESQEYCPDCRGTGKIITKVCSQCNGRKYIEKEETIDLDIKSGVVNGSILQYSQKGNSWNGTIGNLNLNIYVQPSKIFQRKDKTIYANVLVDPVDAITGARIKIPTPYGIKEIDMKPNTANNEEINVSGYGIKNIKHKMFGGNANGDLIVTIVYARPKKYSKLEIEKMKSINNNKNPDVEEFERIVSKELN
ncbi:MAG: DnaJ domain-containing protein [Mycoplasmataceae bacterium]|nr:DnaJ domain-containing protein [Mycoplasmataceae bacterium]